MNEKVLSNRELAQVKRIAQNVDINYQKVCKLNEKINALIEEKDLLQQEIDEMEAPVIRKTGGYRSIDIFTKVIVPQFNEDGTPKVDKEGRQIKVTKWALRYGDSILPPVADEDNLCDTPDGTVVPTTENMAGSDFDLDKNNYE